MVGGGLTGATLAWMAGYTASIEVAAPIERAFAVFIDASRFDQWHAVALRAFEQTGPLSRPGSTVRIDHGPGMKRTMTILEADPPHRLLFRQQGMGVEDTTEVTFRSASGGTQVSMTADLHVAGGPIGGLLERLGRGKTRREFQAELERFGAVVERPRPVPHPPGTLVTADCGAGFRVLKVLGADETEVHVALLPGASPKRPADPAPFLDRESRLDDPLRLRSLNASLRGMASRIVPGQPALRLDGGIGVPHVAMSPDAYGDARPEPVGNPVDIWEHEHAELASWRAAGGPVLGRDVNAGITTLMTVRVDDGYGAVKLLHADRHGVHVRLYADRWDTPPDDIDPWALRLGTIEDAVVGVGYMPLSREAFAEWEPSFDRLVMIGPDELDGYRTWLEGGGGYFG